MKELIFQYTMDLIPLNPMNTSVGMFSGHCVHTALDR